MKLKLLSNRAFAFLSLLFCLNITAIAQQSFYVSQTGNDANSGTLAAPFKTLTKARDVVRTHIPAMTGNITVYLAGGYYPLAGTLFFNSKDTGRNGFRVIYRAQGNGLPVISGGAPITGWTAEANGLYSAPAGGLRFRQLYINGVRAQRARHPNGNSFYKVILWIGPTWDGNPSIKRTIQINAAEISNWNRLNEVEMRIHKEWVFNSLRLGSFATSAGTATVTLKDTNDVKRGFGGHCYLRQPSDQNCMTWRTPTHDAFYYENAFEFLDQPGEWYHNTGTDRIHYKPRTGENMATAIGIVPKVERLLWIQGTFFDNLQYLEFRDLAFAYSNFIEPSSEGFAANQADVITSVNGRVPPAIYVRYAKNITFEGNIFRNLGGVGLALYSGTRDIRVTGNVFHTLAGGGIVVDHLLEKAPVAEELCSGNRIENNYVTRVGLDYPSSVGIFGGYPENTLIAHNELEDLPYTGISMGWGWTPALTSLKNNVIRDNLIHGAMRQLADGGGIYTISNAPGSQITGNRIYDLHRSPGAGQFPLAAIYLDQATAGYTVDKNEVTNVDSVYNFNQTGSNIIGSHTTLAPSAGIESAYQWIKGVNRWQFVPPAKISEPAFPPVFLANMRMGNSVWKIHDLSGKCVAEWTSSVPLNKAKLLKTAQLFSLSNGVYFILGIRPTDRFRIAVMGR